LTLESYFHKKHNKATSAALIVSIKRASYCGFFFGASDSAIKFVSALVFWYGAKVVQEGSFSVKSIRTVFSMLLFSTANANAVIAYIPQISSSADTATRLLWLSNLPLHRSHEHSGTVKLNNSDPRILSGPIKFINLTFSYPSRGPSAPALSRLNLTIRSGTFTALVGGSGSGKSTIASLFLGLYPPGTLPNVHHPSDASSEPPSLTLSGHDIRSLHIPALRSAIAIVSQTPTLFLTSVRQNITYGLDLLSPLTTTANVHSAAKQAGIHDFILTLPRGYDTQIGEGGLGLSGGQAQRVVIARTLCRKPRILVLNEATSALYGEFAEVVRRSIASLIEQSRRRETGHVVGRGASGRETSAATPATASARTSSMTVLIITQCKGDDAVCGECGCAGQGERGGGGVVWRTSRQEGRAALEDVEGCWWYWCWCWWE
jgi:ATP-binding cassette, subfamily B (MDR/TAP), member 1